jgi:tellurite resistance protein
MNSRWDAFDADELDIITGALSMRWSFFEERKWRALASQCSKLRDEAEAAELARSMRRRKETA